MDCRQHTTEVSAKKQDHRAGSQPTADQGRHTLAQPDRTTRRGRRDVLACLHDTSAVVQELADLDVRDIRLRNPAIAR